MVRTLAASAALVTAAAIGGARAQPAGAPVDVRVLSAPLVVAGSDGGRHLAYELLVTSFDSRTPVLRLESVDVEAEPGGARLARLDRDALASRVVHPGGAPPTLDVRAIPGGRHALVYVWLTLDDRQPAPVRLRHRLAFRHDGGDTTVDGFVVDVRSASPVALAPPFRSGLWLAHEGPGAHRSHHWGSQLAQNGRVTIPQRFAIDFIGLDDAGRAVRGDVRTSSNDNWVGFGADVLAVADGVARDTQDGIADNRPLAPVSAPPSVTARALYGNYVVIEVRPGIFVHLAHLQKGSVQVRTGQRVKRGQVLGRVGNSGNTNGPHLHLHVSDRVTFEGSDGLPFAMSPLGMLGETTAGRAIGVEPAAPLILTPVARPRALPLHGAVVRFDAALR